MSYPSLFRKIAELEKENEELKLMVENYKIRYKEVVTINIKLRTGLKAVRNKYNGRVTHERE